MSQQISAMNQKKKSYGFQIFFFFWIFMTYIILNSKPDELRYDFYFFSCICMCPSEFLFRFVKITKMYFIFKRISVNIPCLALVSQVTIILLESDFNQCCLPQGIFMQHDQHFQSLSPYNWHFVWWTHCYRWLPSQRASNAKLWWFLCC